MTPNQRERAVTKAVAAMEKAADALNDLQSICIEYGVDINQEERFVSELRERSAYWANCSWYKKNPNQ